VQLDKKLDQIQLALLGGSPPGVDDELIKIRRELSEDQSLAASGLRAELLECCLATYSSAAKRVSTAASAGGLRKRGQLAKSKFGADLPQGVLHLGSSGEAFSFDWSARFDEEFCEVSPEVWAVFPWVDYWFIDHGPCIRVWVVAIAEEFVENHADRKQIGGDRPAGEVGVRGLVWGCA
jgi:hypothetical protein